MYGAANFARCCLQGSEVSDECEFRARDADANESSRAMLCRKSLQIECCCRYAWAEMAKRAAHIALLDVASNAVHAGSDAMQMQMRQMQQVERVMMRCRKSLQIECYRYA